MQSPYFRGQESLINACGNVMTARFCSQGQRIGLGAAQFIGRDVVIASESLLHL